MRVDSKVEVKDDKAWGGRQVGEIRPRKRPQEASQAVQEAKAEEVETQGETEWKEGGVELAGAHGGV